MRRFTLDPGRWYAMMLLGDEFDATAMCSLAPSPVRVETITPLKTGQGQFELAFLHANCPEGAQDRMYRLRTIHRGQAGLLVQSEDHDPTRFFYIAELTTGWLQHNFPTFDLEGASPQIALDRAFDKSDNEVKGPLGSSMNRLEVDPTRKACHWATDEYWIEASERWQAVRSQGTVKLNVRAIEEVVFNGDGPAYKLMEAMVSVWEREGWEGYRGAPRVLLATLARLAELENQKGR